MKTAAQAANNLYWFHGGLLYKRALGLGQQHMRKRAVNAVRELLLVELQELMLALAQ